MVSVMTVGLKVNRTVRVSNLSDSIDENLLRCFLSAYGNLEELQRGPGVGRDAVWTAVFDCERDARAAVLLSGTPLQGVPVSITLAADAESAALRGAGGLPSSGGNPAVDAVTMAAYRMTQEEELRKYRTAPAVPRPAAHCVQPPLSQTRTAASTPAAAAEPRGVTPQLMQMVKNQPALALELIPQLQAESSGQENSQQLQMLQLAAVFHRQREERERGLREQQKALALACTLQKVQAEEAAADCPRRRKRRRGASSESTRSSGPSGSSSGGSSSSRGRRRRRRRHRNRGDDGARSDRRRRRSRSSGRRGASADGPALPPAPAPDAAYATARETAHLLGMLRPGVPPPATAAVHSELRQYGEVTDLKVSKSSGCVYASFADAAAARSARSAARRAAQGPLAAAEWHFARTHYQRYLKSKADGPQ